MKVILRPVGQGNWRPLIITVENFPRQQGRLFRKDDDDRELVKPKDVWVIDGRPWRVSEVIQRKARR